jgi:metal-responsive CopG/Arc/MetJ family transcriptional regulator
MMQHSDTTKNMQIAKKHITVRLDPELLSHIQHLCQSDEFKTRTAFIERACNTYVEYKRLQEEKYATLDLNNLS